MVDQAYTNDPQASNGEVKIGGYEFPVLGGEVNELDLARFQNKVTFGDYGLDSDPLLSSQILSSFTGGMGNETLKEGVDDDTFWDATLETRYPDGASLLPLTTSYAGTVSTASTARALGDFPASSPSFHAAFDQKIHRWNESTDTFDYVATTGVIDLPFSPVERGVEFEGAFYIPLGANGYTILESDNSMTHSTALTPIHFIVWDRKLMALTSDGVLWMKPPGGAAFGYAATAGATAVTLPSGNIPRKLVNFVTSNGTPALHIVTNTLVFAYDPNGEELYETKLDFPKHPKQGLGAVNWRGDTMYVSVGTGIHGYNGTNITSMGPDGRHGLPARLRGSIIDLVGEYNALLAMVEGQPVVTTSEDPYADTPSMTEDWHLTGLASTTAFSSIVRWSNSQWHKVWESPDASGTPSWMAISEASGAYRLWWGYGAKMYTQELPVAFQNPKQALRSGVTRFHPSGFLITGWFDADMTAFTKLATHVEVNLDAVLDDGVEAGGTVTIQYQRNYDTSWATLGTADTVGKTILPFQYVIHPSGINFSTGLSFRRIRFRIRYAQKSGSITLSPVMSSLVFKFIKIPESQLSWSFTVDLSQPNGFKGRGNKELANRLRTALFSEEFTDFIYQEDVYRARVAQTVGEKKTGFDERGNYRVNLVQVSLGSTRDESTVIKYVDAKTP